MNNTNLGAHLQQYGLHQILYEVEEGNALKPPVPIEPGDPL